MAEQLGQDFRVFKGDGASPEVFTEIAGQRGLTRDISTNLIDQSSKSAGLFGLQTPGRKQITFSVTGVRDLPDASGLEAVYAQQAGSSSQVAANYRVMNTGVSPNTTVFEASMYVSNFSQDDDDQDSGGYSFQLTLAAAPTTDDLTP